jgi:hypothetical protein
VTLLELLLPSQDHDALLGDICEEARRRSRLWYWAQLVAVLAIGSWRELRRHPLLALRGVATGVAMLMIYYTIVAAIARAMWVLANGGYYVGGPWLTLPPGLVPERYDVLMVLAVNSLGFGISGWAATRSHRAYGIAMTMPYLAITGLMSLVLITSVVTDTGPGTRTLPLLGVISIVGMIFVSMPVSVLLGALAGLRTGARHGPKLIGAGGS